MATSSHMRSVDRALDVLYLLGRRSAGLCLVTPAGAQPDEDGTDHLETPSSEAPMHLAIYAATSAAAWGRSCVTILAAGARRWVPRVGAAHRRGLIINRLTCCSKDTSIPSRKFIQTL